MNSKSPLLFIGLMTPALILVLSSCGYRFVGTSQFPTGIRSVYVEILENRTAEPALGTIFTQDIIEEFMRNSGSESIAPDPDSADAVMSGSVWSMRTGTITTKGHHTPVERRVEIGISLSIFRKNGDPVWTRRNFNDNEAYVVQAEKISTEQTRLEAIREISKRLAERVYQDLASGF